jgi:hypothetical protein
LGQFLSPDSIVPEPTSFLDYNRYLYAKGNPLKYSDPSGHCATNEDGSRSEDDANCWSYVDEIIRFWNNDPNYWNGLFKNQDTWLKNLATNNFFDKDWMFNQYETYLGSASYIQVHNQQQAERAKLPIQKRTYGPSPCDFWDCIALGYDITAIGGNLLTSASLAGELPSGGITTAGVASGILINQTATVGGLAHTIEGYATHQSSAADVIVVTATSFGNPFPVFGSITGAAQLLWDLADPLIPFW